ncbi:hypothetical protein CHARACLAT_019963 [Characodon lateralis]|uniref:Uncharacterized protein n=1 Tax=Characodon lateralis TaxID=208331 RepID=A0ABU7E1Y7_9TELE|nr:hypothetical protein [Characodon lateralis]
MQLAGTVISYGRLGGLFSLYDHVSMIKTRNLQPLAGRSADSKEKLKKTEGHFLIKTSTDRSEEGVPHVLLADVTSHVGPIYLSTLWKRVTVGEAGSNAPCFV